LKAVGGGIFSKDKEDDNQGDEKVKDGAVEQFGGGEGVVFIENQQGGAEDGDEGDFSVEIELGHVKHPKLR